MEYDIPLTVKLDRQTADFLNSMRDNDHVNVSSWVRDAIRAKAGLSPHPPEPPKLK